MLWEKYDAFAKAVFAEPADVQAVFDADNAFHDCLSAIGENPMIGKINSLVRTLTHDLRYRTVSNMLAIGQGRTLLDAHKHICDAISSKDASNLDAIVHDGYFYDRVDVQRLP